MCQVSRFVKRVHESHPQRSRDAGVPFPRPKAFPLMGLQQRLVEAFCCPSPLSVSTLICPGLFEVYD